MLKMKTTKYRQGNKYHAQKTKGFTSGKMYDSKAECDRAEYLKLEEADKRIEGLQEHPKINLTKFHMYKPDFVYHENGRLVFEDCKGAITDRFRINMKLWRERGPGVLRVSKRAGKYGKWQFKDLHPDTIDTAMWDGYVGEAPPKAEPVSPKLPPTTQRGES